MCLSLKNILIPRKIIEAPKIFFAYWYFSFFFFFLEQVDRIEG